MSPRRAAFDAPEPSIDERHPLDAFFAAKYRDLRRMAASLSRNEGNLTLSPTALVNEAWLKLAGSSSFGQLSALHFKALAARAMRRVLIDAARRRRARKRSHDGTGIRVALDETVERHAAVAQDVLELDAALTDLERRAPRQARVVEGRYFGGLTSAELATLLDVSDATIERDWRLARAWLKTQLTRS